LVLAQLNSTGLRAVALHEMLSGDSRKAEEFHRAASLGRVDVVLATV